MTTRQVCRNALIAICILAASPPVFAIDGFSPLVSADWLAANLDDPDLVVLDATVVIEQGDDGSTVTRSGRSKYAAGHIPGARFADLKGELADGDSALGYILPSPEEFAAAMGRLGVGDGKTVVIYDSTNTLWAARVWWMLRWVGFDNAALLDGGLSAWEAAGHDLSDKPVTPEQATLTPRVRPELVADQAEVRTAITDSSVSLVDALPPGHYNGEWGMYARPGHIASASNVPTGSLMDETGRFLPVSELESILADYRSGRTITYCGGGISASGLAFAMTLAGIEDVAVYTNSLQEWTLDPENPMEVSTQNVEPD